MDTRELARTYFEAIKDGTWKEFAASDFAYQVQNSEQPLNKEQFLQGAGRFYSLVQKVEVIQLLVEGDQAAAINRYQLLSPAGKKQSLEVSEFLRFDAEGKLASMAIFFDSAVLQALNEG